MWKSLIATKPQIKEVRPDELQAAYLIVESFFQVLYKKGKINEKEDQSLLEKVISKKLDAAIYLKTIELLAPKTISAFFQCKSYRYGLRLDAISYPKEAFTKNTLEDTFIPYKPRC